MQNAEPPLYYGTLLYPCDMIKQGENNSFQINKEDKGVHKVCKSWGGGGGDKTEKKKKKNGEKETKYLK